MELAVASLRGLARRATGTVDTAIAVTSPVSPVNQINEEFPLRQSVHRTRTGTLRDAAVDHVAAICGVRTHVFCPASFLHRLRPCIADQHCRARDLVERVVRRLARDRDRLELAG